MHLDQVDLTRRLLAADPSVLKELEIDVWPVVRWRIEQRFAGCLRRSDMPDVLQETLLAVWTSRGNYDDSRGSVPSWFAGIAFNVARDAARQSWQKQRQCERGADLLEFAAVAPAREEADDIGAEVGHRQEALTLLNECLAEMTDRRRAILFACDAANGERPTSHELADEFGISPEALRQELHRAEVFVRDYFERHGAAAAHPTPGG